VQGDDPYQLDRLAFISVEARLDALTKTIYVE